MLFEDALDEVRRHAFQEGIEKTQRDIILRMHQDGLSADLISRYTGVSSEEVEKIIAGDHPAG